LLAIQVSTAILRSNSPPTVFYKVKKMLLRILCVALSLARWTLTGCDRRPAKIMDDAAATTGDAVTPPGRCQLTHWRAVDAAGDAVDATGDAVCRRGGRKPLLWLTMPTDTADAAGRRSRQKSPLR